MVDSVIEFRLNFESVVEPFCCGYNHRFMAIAYFCRRASSCMSFDRIPNTTLPNTLLEFKGGHKRTFPPLVTQGNFELTETKK